MWFERHGWLVHTLQVSRSFSLVPAWDQSAAHTVQLTVCFSGGHVCEQQQACIFRQAAEESQTAQQQLRQTLGKPAVVEVEISSSNQIARSRMEADAAAPNVAFWHATNCRTDGWQIVGNLGEERVQIQSFVIHLNTSETFHQFRPPYLPRGTMRPPTWQCVYVASSKWYTREMKRQAIRPVSGSRTIPTAKLVKGSRMRGRSRSRLPYGPWSILGHQTRGGRHKCLEGI